MALIPLKGRLLSVTNLMARFRPAAVLLAGVAAREMQADRLIRMDLPDPDDDPRPRQAAPPRSWEDAGLGAPTSHRHTAAALRASYASGRSRPSEELERVISWIEAGRYGEITHSPFTILDVDISRRAARESDARWWEGRPLGPLDGIPVPVKDEHDMVGLPTTMGLIWRTEPASSDSFLVRRLRAGGALLFAKTSLPELGSTPLGTHPHHDLARNAWDHDRAAGGSSTGSAVAVALGLCPVATGSDAGGSIRIPSAFNGVFGIKPTWVRIGRTGNPLAMLTLPHLGPIGASTADLVDFLEVAASEPDPDDAITSEAPDLGSAAARWRAALGRGVRGARIGVDEESWAEAAPGVATVARAALSALERLGARIVPVDLPISRHAFPFLSLELLHEAKLSFGTELAENFHRLGVDAQLSQRVGAVLPAQFHLRARQGREAIRREWRQALSRVDLVATPTTAQTAPVYPRDAGPMALHDLGSVASACRYVGPSNLTGLPAGTAPVGLDEGLPVGLQLVGDAWDEASVLAGMAALEREGVTDLPTPPGALRRDR